MLKWNESELLILDRTGILKKLLSITVGAEMNREPG